MKKISILGCGWLGLPLAKKLVSEGYEVKGSTTSGDKLEQIRSVGVSPYLLRLTKDTEVDTGFLDSDILILNIPPSKYKHSDFLASLKNLKSQVESSSISRVIYISSTSVYPSNNREVTEGDADYIPTSRSGIVMLETEDIWRESSAFDYFVVRFAGLFGPDRNPGRFLSGKETNGGKNPVNMIHLHDCIGVIEVLLKQSQWNDTFNACSPHHPTRYDFYEHASRKLGIEPPVFSEPHYTEHKIVNSDKLIRLLSYRFQKEHLIEALETL